jgi:hypothetical protein
MSAHTGTRAASATRRQFVPRDRRPLCARKASVALAIAFASQTALGARAHRRQWSGPGSHEWAIAFVAKRSPPLARANDFCRRQRSRDGDGGRLKRNRAAVVGTPCPCPTGRSGARAAHGRLARVMVRAHLLAGPRFAAACWKLKQPLTQADMRRVRDLPGKFRTRTYQRTRLSL